MRGRGSMSKKWLTIFIGFVLALMLASCDLDADGAHHEIGEATAIEELEDIEHFRAVELPNIMEGELNKKGQDVGCQYDQLPTKKDEIVSGTETKPNEYGVNEAKIMVSDVEKKSNRGKSTFFPDEW